MTVIVPHNKTKQEMVATVDRVAAELFAGGGGLPIDIVDAKKDWVGSTMGCSLTGRLGFISIPLSGTVEVDDRNVILNCELPAMLKNFIGEEKIRPIVEQTIKGLIA